MAKKIYNHNGEFAHYEPGVIYDIGVIDPITKTRTPFYVGETSDPAGRLAAHKRAGNNADNESTLVYQHINKLNAEGRAWDMQIVAEFGKEGPTDLEDEWIMKHLYNGYKLKNMKKGNANWMAEREACAADMRKRNISSYKKYREVITQEDLDRRHAEWLAKEEAERKRLEAEWLAEAARQQKILASQRRAEEVRKQLEREMEERRLLQIKEQKEQELAEAKRRADAQVRWEADHLAREARLKAEAEARAAAETKRNTEWQEQQQRQQEIKQANEKLKQEQEQEYLIKILTTDKLSQYDFVQKSKFIVNVIKEKGIAEWQEFDQKLKEQQRG
jgi:hypothetical protein